MKREPTDWGRVFAKHVYAKGSWSQSPPGSAPWRLPTPHPPRQLPLSLDPFLPLPGLHTPLSFLQRAPLLCHQEAQSHLASSSPTSFLNSPSCPGNFCKPSLLKMMLQFGFPADLALTALPLTCKKGRGLTALWGHLKYSKTGPRDKVKHNGERSVKPELDSVSETLVRKWRWLRAFLHPGLCSEVVDVNGLGQSWPSEPLLTSQVQVCDGGLSTPCSS